MSFSTIRSQNSSRFNEVQLFLNYITSQEPSSPTEIIPAEIKIMRGLFYVHLYAALERSLNEAVQHLLLIISSKCVQSNHFILVFNTITVMDKIKTLKDCSYKKVIDNSTKLFQVIDSKNVIPINETIFANQLQNVWVKTVDEIILALGIKPLNISQRERATIDEIVDKRNIVAHGRESASYVGERHRTIILREKLQIAQDFIILIIDTFESYFVSKKYLKPGVRNRY